jgi:hypothetical protein
LQGGAESEENNAHIDELASIIALSISLSIGAGIDNISMLDQVEYRKISETILIGSGFRHDDEEEEQKQSHRLQKTPQVGKMKTTIAVQKKDTNMNLGSYWRCQYHYTTHSLDD